MELFLITTFYTILFNLIDMSLSFNSFINDFLYSTGIFGFSLSSVLNLIPDSFRNIIVYYLTELGFTTSLNIYLSFLAIKVSLRLIPYIGRLF